MSSKIVNLAQEGNFVVFELEDGTLKTKEMNLTKSQEAAIMGCDYEEVFGTHNIENVKKKTMEIDVEVFDNMKKQLEQMAQWQSDQQHNQLENSRLTDVLNRRRSGEDSAPTKADLMESEREQTRTIIYEERKLIFEEKSKREKKDFITSEGDKIRASLEKHGNMTGSPIKGRPGEGQEEFNNMVFGGGRR